MWYVIQTLGGEEERTAQLIRRQIPSYCIEECFIPKRVRMKKFQGAWNQVEEILFHGYVFACSKRPEEFYRELKRIPRLARMLGREEGYFFPLSEKEEQLVRCIGDEEHKTGLSEIEVLEGKRVRVVRGPLKDYAGDIVRVNLHKREVVVRVEFMGKPVELFMGVEIAEKEERKAVEPGQMSLR